MGYKELCWPLFLSAICTLHFRITKISLMNAVWSYLIFIFLISSLLIALLRPYKRMYVNIFDTILLANITLICHLHTGRYFAGEAWQIMTLTSFPIILFGGLTLYNVGIQLKAKPRLMNIWQHYWKKRMKF